MSSKLRIAIIAALICGNAFCSTSDSSSPSTSDYASGGDPMEMLAHAKNEFTNDTEHAESFDSTLIQKTKPRTPSGSSESDLSLSDIMTQNYISAESNTDSAIGSLSSEIIFTRTSNEYFDLCVEAGKLPGAVEEEELGETESLFSDTNDFNLSSPELNDANTSLDESSGFSDLLNFNYNESHDLNDGSEDEQSPLKNKSALDGSAKEIVVKESENIGASLIDSEVPNHDLANSLMIQQNDDEPLSISPQLKTSDIEAEAEIPVVVVEAETENPLSSNKAEQKEVLDEQLAINSESSSDKGDVESKEEHNDDGGDESTEEKPQVVPVIDQVTESDTKDSSAAEQQEEKEDVQKKSIQVTSENADKPVQKLETEEPIKFDPSSSISTEAERTETTTNLNEPTKEQTIDQSIEILANVEKKDIVPEKAEEDALEDSASDKAMILVDEIKMEEPIQAELAQVMQVDEVIVVEENVQDSSNSQRSTASELIQSSSEDDSSSEVSKKETKNEEPIQAEMKKDISVQKIDQGDSQLSSSNESTASASEATQRDSEDDSESTDSTLVVAETVDKEINVKEQLVEIKKDVASIPIQKDEQSDAQNSSSSAHDSSSDSDSTQIDSEEDSSAEVPSSSSVVADSVGKDIKIEEPVQVGVKKDDVPIPEQKVDQGNDSSAQSSSKNSDLTQRDSEHNASLSQLETLVVDDDFESSSSSESDNLSTIVDEVILEKDSPLYNELKKQDAIHVEDENKKSVKEPFKIIEKSCDSWTSSSEESVKFKVETNTKEDKQPEWSSLEDSSEDSSSSASEAVSKQKPEAFVASASSVSEESPVLKRTPTPVPSVQQKEVAKPQHPLPGSSTHKTCPFTSQERKGNTSGFQAPIKNASPQMQRQSPPQNQQSDYYHQFRVHPNAPLTQKRTNGSHRQPGYPIDIPDQADSGSNIPNPSNSAPPTQYRAGPTKEEILAHGVRYFKNFMKPRRHHKSRRPTDPINDFKNEKYDEKIFVFPTAPAIVKPPKLQIAINPHSGPKIFIKLMEMVHGKSRRKHRYHISSAAA